MYVVPFMMITTVCILDSLLSSAPSTSPQKPVVLQHFQSVQNESYGVLGGGVPQSIELKDNTAYSSVQALSATSQSIAVNSNVAYGVTTATTEPSYEDPSNYY